MCRVDRPELSRGGTRFEKLQAIGEIVRAWMGDRFKQECVLRMALGNQEVVGS